MAASDHKAAGTAKHLLTVSSPTASRTLLVMNDYALADVGASGPTRVGAWDLLDNPVPARVLVGNLGAHCWRFVEYAVCLNFSYE